MINLEEEIEKVKAILGYSNMKLELNNKVLENLMQISNDKFHFYKTFNKELADKIDYYWITSFFQALCKESIGNVRSVYSEVLPLPGIQKNSIDFKHLIEEGVKEKNSLIKMLYSDYYYDNNSEITLIALYLKVENSDKSEVETVINKLREQFDSILPSFVKIFIIPVSNQNTSFEVLHSSINEDIEKIYDLTQTLKDLDSNIEKYIK